MEYYRLLGGVLYTNDLPNFTLKGVWYKNYLNIFTLKTNSSERKHILMQFSVIFQIYFNSIFK